MNVQLKYEVSYVGAWPIQKKSNTVRTLQRDGDLIFFNLSGGVVVNVLRGSFIIFAS